MTRAPTPILFVANNPGGFRALAPVMRALAPQSRLWLAPALIALCEHTRTAELCELTPSLRIDELQQRLQECAPRVLVTGTSVGSSPGGQLENQLRQLARTHGIPSISVIDHWCNYAARFSMHGTTCDALADHICVIDARARADAIAEGIPAAALHITGHPGFDALLAMSAAERRALRDECRTAWGVSATDRVIGFISEPLREDYGTLRSYDQFQVWEWLCRALAPTPTTFVMRKLHPRETAAAWASATAPARMIDGASTSPRAAVLACDLVIGMTSVLLFEAALLGQPIWSVQPHAAAQAPWHQLMRAFPLLTEESTFRTELAAWASSDATSNPPPNFYTETRATDNVVSLIRTVSAS